jgi:hypothetical protein
MGLDAYVYCNCFKEGKTKTPPVDKSDIIIDEDGNFTLKFPYSEETAVYHNLFDNWIKTCCPHPEMQIIHVRVGNWSAISILRESLIKAGEKRFPVLLGNIGYTNGGLVPTKLAPSALNEIDLFRTLLPKCSNVFLTDAKTGEELYEYVQAHDGCVSFDGKNKIDIGFDRAGFFIRDTVKKNVMFRSKHIIVTKHTSPFSGRIMFEYRDKRSGRRAFYEAYFPEKSLPFELKVIKRKLKAEDFSYILNTLESLFRASIETGNPVYWS